MVNILFLFSPTIRKKKHSFQTVYKYNKVFAEEKEAQRFF